ncbi:MAG: GcrA cell cycle regulator [Rhizobiales bacterium]|nr:GcrA cell cycle regulator [Hyphomicrobiales bacterium]
MAWTTERVEELKRLWGEGLSASQIAHRIGDVTRNAVIGKVHRLGLSGRATTSRIKSVRPRKKMARPKRARVMRLGGGGVGESLRELLSQNAGAYEAQSFEVPNELVIPVEERKSIATLTEHCCRWPIGDPTHEDFHFCGRERITGLPYCEFHARRAYQPVQARRREQRSEEKVAIAS